MVRAPSWEQESGPAPSLDDGAFGLLKSSLQWGFWKLRVLVSSDTFGFLTYVECLCLQLVLPPVTVVCDGRTVSSMMCVTV